MNPTEDPRTLREARAEFFETEGYALDGGYSDRWVKLSSGRLKLAFPNTQARIRAVRYHDLHHVVTEYGTNWKGESEIGAWEVATGCRDFMAAWYLNLFAMWFGLFFVPRAVWRAFVLGRRTTNFYGDTIDDALLARTVGEERNRMGLNREQIPAGVLDVIAFAIAVAAGSALILLPVAMIVAIVLLWI